MEKDEFERLRLITSETRALVRNIQFLLVLILLMILALLFR